MATKNPPPTLQIAQILADLSDLNVAEPDAALALVTAHHQRQLSRTTTTTANNKGNKPPLSKSSSYVSKESNSAAGGRRSGMTASSSSSPTAYIPGTLSRTLSRQDSSGSGISGSGQWERFGTPSPGAEADPDLERARTLMRLYEIRGSFKQQESGGLARARANVEAVAEKYGMLG